MLPSVFSYSTSPRVPNIDSGLAYSPLLRFITYYYELQTACASSSAPAGSWGLLMDQAEAQEAQVQAGPQEQPARLFSRPDGNVARPHIHGLHSQCSPHVHVVCCPRWPCPPLPDVHLQSLPPGHGTAHPHLSSHPMSPLLRCSGASFARATEG